MRYVALLGVLVLVGCATTRLTPAGEGIRVTSNPEAVRGCDYLGPVEGWTWQEENANRMLRNSAAELGADVVMMVSSNVGTRGDHIVRGEAYACASGGH
jgi:hypothetical protein